MLPEQNEQMLTMYDNFFKEVFGKVNKKELNLKGTDCESHWIARDHGNQIMRFLRQLENIDLTDEVLIGEDIHTLLTPGELKGLADIIFCDDPEYYIAPEEYLYTFKKIKLIKPESK